MRPKPFLTEEEKEKPTADYKSTAQTHFSYLLPYWPKLLLLVLAAIILSSILGFCHPSSPERSSTKG